MVAHSGPSADNRECFPDAFAEHGPDRLRPIFDALEGAVSYDELHVLRVYALCRDAGLEEGQ